MALKFFDYLPIYIIIYEKMYKKGGTEDIEKGEKIEGFFEKTLNEYAKFSFGEAKDRMRF